MEGTAKYFSELQDIIWRTSSSESICLPEVVVVGAQSVGKSTVVESIIGYEILPKGNDIQTRCPIRINLHKIMEMNEYATCEGIEKQMSIEHLQQCIKTQSDSIAKSEYVTNRPLIVHIYSPKVISLTVVDTPGLTRIRLDNQPENIVDLLENIAKSYIRNNKSIILAISAASTDLANSEALRIAKEIDPELKRTLGVLTKIDMMNKNASCLDVMQNKLFRLQMGFVGIKCNYERYTEGDKIDFNKIIINEKQFFELHPIYGKHMSVFGINTLKDKLSVIFNESIRSSIPGLTEEFKRKYEIIKESLISLGEMNSKEINFISEAMRIVSNINEELTKQIEGNSFGYSLEELQGGSEFRKVFLEYQESMDKLRSVDVREIDIENLFKNTNALEEHYVLKKTLILTVLPTLFKSIQENIDKCVETIDKIFRKIIEKIDFEDFKKFEKIRSLYLKEYLKVIRKNKKKTVEKLNFLVFLEKSYINPDDDGVKIIDKGTSENEYAYDLIKFYYEQSRESLKRSVPKFIKFHFIDENCKQGYNAMREKVCNFDVARSLFRKDQKIVDNFNRLILEKSTTKEILKKLEQIGNEF
ncbi:hypothetical protein SteCoe_3773 [Stentor coeruleus]|uniref:Dynamin-type G domain-containing protein n=1 Tax=Stentor coeruleus TaxID=5963 RepID=A0A1R2CWC5_9CILI|nr:hypothetical protein SteCoe_3773 [Stentor coeruleus]